MDDSISVGILGAGISGLSIAYELQKNGISATVYEKSNYVGGAIHSVEQDGWMIEEGPNTLMVKSQEIWDMLDDLDLTSDIVEANKIAKKRFVVKDRKPVPVPMSAGSFVTTSLISAGAKLRLFKEPLVRATQKNDESVASFIKRRLGQQPLDYGVNPFVSGIYAGDPKKLSVKHTFSMLWELEQQYGSIAKGMLKKERSQNRPNRAMISFKKGNQMLPEALAKSLVKPVQTSTEITSLKRSGAQWEITGQQSGKGFESYHDCLISTLPTHVLPALFESNLFNELADLPYAPVSVMGLGFKANEIDHPLDGFGMLIPEVEDFKTLGVLFSSTLFPNRAPNGSKLLTCFIGGARNPELAKKSQKKLAQIILNELTQLLGLNGQPTFQHHKYWEKAIPQYSVGYDNYLSVIERIEAQNEGLYLQGNFRGGVSVPDCISSGFETARKALAFLKAK